MKRKTIVISRVLMVLYFAALAYLCFGHFNNMPKVPRIIMGFEADKIVHFAMFLPFPILFYLSAGREYSKIWQGCLFATIIFISGCMIGAGTELMQGICTNYRTPDIADFKADAAAIAFSSVIVFLSIITRIIKKNITG